MNRRLALLLVAACAVAAVATADPHDYLQRLRPALDFIFTAVPGPGVKLQDVRVAPICRMDQWEEVPIEVGLFGPAAPLQEALARLSAYATAATRLRVKSLTVSASAETSREGQALLTATVQPTLFLGQPSPAELPASATADGAIAGFFGGLLGIAGFEPTIDRATRTLRPGAKPVWLTNLRIDGDRRVQMTGFAAEGPAITAFAAELEALAGVGEVFLLSANRCAFFQAPVWRFDLAARLE